MPSEILTISEQKDGRRPFEVLLLSKKAIDSWWYGRFVIELASLQYHKERLPVDFNHNDYILIGYAENFRNTEEGLVAGGSLLTDAEGETGEFARNIVTWIDGGIPMEASAAVDLDAAVCETVPTGQTVEVDGVTHAGPITIFRNVPLVGLAACPHGADKFTRFTLLSWEKNVMPKITPKKLAQTNLTKLSDAETPPETPPEKTVKDQDLAEFIAVFGTEKGLELWQSGADIAEVRQLKELLDKYGQPEAASTESDDNPPEPEPEPKKDDETAKLSALLKPLTDSVTKLSGELNTIKAAMPRGETTPLHHGLAGGGHSETKLAQTSVDKMAAKYAENG